MAKPTDRLLSQLNQTQLQIKDNPTYQVIKQLIDRIRDLENLLGIASSTPSVTNLTQIQQFIVGGGSGDESSDAVPVPGSRGPTGAAGATGSRGPTTIGPMGLNGEDGDDGKPIPGNRGATGIQGPQGIAGRPAFILIQGEDGENAPVIPGKNGTISPLIFLKKTSQQTINAGAGVYTDVTELTFPVVNGNTYGFKFYVVWQSAATTTGWKSSLNCPNGTLDFFCTHQTIANSATVGVSTWLHRHSVTRDDLTTLISTITASVDLVVMYEGRYICTQDGTFAVRFANELAANTDITVEAGSWGYYWKQ